jgi:phenylpropionate dioxygenase-like ring-hydroxylating dioxygenase large terminal subunit
VARFPKPAEGSWTQHYPDLGTGPVSYEDSISPEFFELEREAIFKRAWLNVGRVEQLPRSGSYFTKELAVARTSLIVVRDEQGRVRAFHNICRHRGNKLVWKDFPREETSGTARQFACKYHGWRYGLDGACVFVQQEGEFFGLDKAEYGLVPVHCEVWAGFVFVNLDRTPRQSLREFLGPMVAPLEAYPFGRMTERFSYRARVGSNWKIFSDAFQEFYHAPVLHAGQTPPAVAARAREAGFEAPHYQISSPHRLLSSSGIRAWELPAEASKPMERLTRAGLFGAWDAPRLEPGAVPAAVNPGRCDPWGMSTFQIWPNMVILIWSLDWVHTYHYWPSSHNAMDFEANLLFVPAANARERLAHEMAAATFKEFALQDANTLEATQMMLESRAVERFPLGDQEVTCRHFHKTAGDWVDAYRRERAREGA